VRGLGKMFPGGCHLHLNRSASDPLMWCTIKLQKFRPLNALISAPVRSDRPGHHEGKKGEQHGAEDLGSDGRSQAEQERIC
jgi:hypothetical protein